jgi:hypothetical protein
MGEILIGNQLPADVGLRVHICGEPFSIGTITAVRLPPTWPAPAMIAHFWHNIMPIRKGHISVGRVGPRPPHFPRTPPPCEARSTPQSTSCAPWGRPPAAKSRAQLSPSRKFIPQSRGFPPLAPLRIMLPLAGEPSCSIRTRGENRAWYAIDDDVPCISAVHAVVAYDL